MALPASLVEAARAAVPAGAVPFVKPLAIPPFFDVTQGGPHELVMENAKHDFYTGSQTSVFRYAVADQGYTPPQLPYPLVDTVLGPTIVAKRGTPVTINVTNNLGPHPLADAIDTGIDGATDADTTAPRAAVHLHGGHTKATDDGGPHDVILKGGSHPFAYGNLQQAANIWYHDHVIGITRLNVYAGLAGGYLIRDADDDGSGDKFPAPPYELPLIIQDKMFNANGSLAYPPNATPAAGTPTQGKWVPEFFGDVAVVNGIAWPNLDVEQGKYRFRVYNGSQSRFYKLSLVAPGGTKVAYQQIGTDGGLLNAPVTLTGLVLGPGERADLIVDFAGFGVGTRLRLTNNAPTPYPNGPRKARKGGVPLQSIMQFTVKSATGSTFTKALPASLRSTLITPLAPYVTANTPVRNMALVEVLDPAGLPIKALVNDRPFHDTSWQNLQVPHKADTLEQWNIINLTADAHPIHPHLVQGQLLNRQTIDVAGYQAAGKYPGLPGVAAGASAYSLDAGGPAADPGPFLLGKPKKPAANEQGWKDTFAAMPGEVTRLLLPLGAGAVPGKPMAVDAPSEGAYTGDYVWHCHILEHEEHDMMQHYRVVP